MIIACNRKFMVEIWNSFWNYIRLINYSPHLNMCLAGIPHLNKTAFIHIVQETGLTLNENSSLYILFCSPNWVLDWNGSLDSDRSCNLQNTDVTVPVSFNFLPDIEAWPVEIICVELNLLQCDQENLLFRKISWLQAGQAYHVTVKLSQT